MIAKVKPGHFSSDKVEPHLKLGLFTTRFFIYQYGSSKDKTIFLGNGCIRKILQESISLLKLTFYMICRSK